MLPPSPSWSDSPSSDEEEYRRPSSDEENYRPLDERHFPVITQEDINRHLQEIAQEEAEHYETARRDPERFRNYEGSPETSQPIFQVWTTKW